VIRIVRLGSPRERGEGLRLGTVRRPPRGVRKADYARRDYYDVWLPELSPTPKVIALAGESWDRFAEAYRREMKAPAAARLLELLARLSQNADFSVGCYCEREERCHRSILKKLLAQHGAEVSG
jgi:uncharacterized protein YeaO (DUF488 family)